MAFQNFIFLLWCLGTASTFSSHLLAAEGTESSAGRVVELVRQLAGDDVATREAAVLELENLVTRAARPEAGKERREVAKALAGALAEDHPTAVKRILIESVARVGKWEVVSPLGKMLGDNAADPLLRDAACRALGSNRTPGAKKQLRKALETTEGELRIAVIRALGEHRDPLSAAALMQIAQDDEDAGSRLAAVVALAEIGEISSVDILEGALRTYQGEELRQVQDAYLRFGDSLLRNNERGQARRVYHRAIEMGNTYHAAALVGLAKGGLQSEVQRIATATESEDRVLRTGALEAAAILPGPGMTQALVAKLAESTDSERRLELLASLAERKDKGAREAVQTEFLKASDDATRAAVIDLLAVSYRQPSAEISGPVLDSLLTALAEDGAAARAAARLILSHPSETLDPTLRARLGGLEGEARSKLEQILGQRVQK